MITATSSPDRFGSLLRGLLKKNISNMVYLALIGFIGIPLPYLLAMFRRWEEKGQWVYENISTADRGGLYVGIAVGRYACCGWWAALSWRFPGWAICTTAGRWIFTTACRLPAGSCCWAMCWPTF